MTLYQPLPWAGKFFYINSASQKLCTYLQIGQTFSSKPKNSSQMYRQLQDKQILNLEVWVNVVFSHCCYTQIFPTSFNSLFRYFLHQHQCTHCNEFTVFQNILQFNISSQSQLKELSTTAPQHKTKKVENRKKGRIHRFKLYRVLNGAFAGI